jgi:hypothetical protein
MKRVLFAAVLVIMIAFEVLLSSHAVSEEMLSELKDFQTKQLDVFLEVNKLMTTLAAAAIAATAGFFSGQRAADTRRLAVVWIALGLSLYAGFVTSQQVIWMLDKRFFNLYYAGIVWPSRIQFWGFLIGMLMLAEVVHHSIREKERQA